MKMDELIAGFGKQLTEAIEIGEQAHLSPHHAEIRNIVVTGLGGSGIGGNLVSEFLANELTVPFEVNKDYFIPNYVNEHSLVIASSYSGNTEETLQAFEQAIEKGAKIVCISSGGKMIERAKELNLDHIIVPGGNPPRTALGYSVVQQLYALYKLGLISPAFKADLKAGIQLLNDQQENIHAIAREVAGQLLNKIPVIYVCNPMAAVAVRFKQQINENAKMLCWNHTVPEMNHNELVGWRNKLGPWAVVFLRNKNDYERNSQRMNINKQIVENYTDTIIEIFSEGNSHIEQAFYLIHLTDWVSYYLAELQNNIDAVEVEVIDFLKGSLAKF